MTCWEVELQHVCRMWFYMWNIYINHVMGIENNSPTDVRDLPSLSEIVDLWIEGLPLSNSTATPLVLHMWHNKLDQSISVSASGTHSYSGGFLQGKLHQLAARLCSNILPLFTGLFNPLMFHVTTVSCLPFVVCVTCKSEPSPSNQSLTVLPILTKTCRSHDPSEEAIENNQDGSTLWTVCEAEQTRYGLLKFL